jgi:hypothetical protein
MRRASLLIVAVAGLGIVGNALAEDAGIWQFLLNQGRQSYSPPPAYNLPPPMFAPRMALPHFVRRPTVQRPVVHLRIMRPKAIAHADIPHTKGAVSIYTDRTLRRGDSVMTAQGLRVFKGASHFPYRAADFVALTDASHFVVGDKKQLRDIQLAFERIDVPATQFAALVTGRSVSVASAAAPATEPVGKKIRYVGP